MSTTFEGRLADVTIPSGSDVSRVVSAQLETSDAVGLAILGPADLDVHTFVFECASDLAFTVPRAIMEGSPPAALTPPGALEGRTYFTLPLYPFWRIKDTSGNVAADRTWEVTKTFRA